MDIPRRKILMKIAEILMTPPIRRTFIKKRSQIKRFLDFQPNSDCDCLICTKHKFSDGSSVTHIEAHIGNQIPRKRTFYCHNQLDDFISFLVNNIGWSPKVSVNVYGLGIQGESEDALVDEYHGELKDFLPDAI